MSWFTFYMPNISFANYTYFINKETGNNSYEKIIQDYLYKRDSTLEEL